LNLDKSLVVSSDKRIEAKLKIGGGGVWFEPEGLAPETPLLVLGCVPKIDGERASVLGLDASCSVTGVAVKCS
jgi:hypothetical protein